MPHDDEAAMLEQYHANKYAPRCPTVYVASLYRDAPEGGEGCVCGYSDPLHSHDAQAGWVPLVGAVGSGAASDFRGYSSTSAQLNALSCDAAKSLGVSGPPMLRDEVDALCGSPTARRGPPPLGWNDSAGQQRHEDFEEWMRAKERAALQAEAVRKKRALAELSAQIMRRAQAAQAFEAWKSEKARTPTPTPASKAASAAATAAAAAASPEVIAEKDARRSAVFELWRSSKDSLTLSSVRAERSATSAATERARLERQEAARLAQESFARWTATKAATESARRSSIASDRKHKAREIASTQRAKEAKTKEQLAAWSKDKLTAKCQQRQAQQAQQQAQQEALEKRTREVSETQAAREHRLTSHLQELQRARSAKEALEARASKDAHKQAWKKKEDGPLAYSTLKSQAHVFR